MDEMTPLTSSAPAPMPSVDFTPPSKTSMLKKILIAAIVLGVLVVGILLWWMLGSSGKSLNVSIIAPDRLQSGVPVEVAVAMSNDSSSDLKDAQVSLALPDGLIFVGVPGKRSVENHAVGLLPANQLTKESFTVMATTDAQNTILPVKANVSFIPGALSSRFEKVTSRDLVIGEPGVELNVAPPVKAFGGEEFETEVSFKNLSTANFDSVQLKMNYPAGYSFKSATQPSSDSGNTTWSIGEFPAGSEGKFKIKGFIVGQDNENFELRGTLSASIGEGVYDIASQSVAVALQPSPLSIRVELLSGNDSIVGAGESLRYRLSYTNNTSVGLRDVIARAKLTGEMFDLRTLQTNGVLRASDNTIIWNASREPKFANLAPGMSGELEFTLQTKTSYPITRLSSKNYSLSVRGEIESPTVPANVAASRTLGVTEIVNKVRGVLSVNTLGYYRDATAGIANQGQFPPKVGQPTQFTIHWVVANGASDVENVRIRSFLGPNVRYTGAFKSSIASSTPSYNDRTQEIAWEIPKIQATRGILGDPLEMVFQVELTPSANQIATAPELIQPTEISYRDSFTGEVRTIASKGVSIRLPDDMTLAGSEHAVKE